MGQPSTRITFSWASTLKTIGVFLLMIALGAVLTRADVLWVAGLGYLAVAVVGLGIVMLPFIGGMGRAPCPICGTTIEVMGRKTSYVRCGACGEYFDSDNRLLRQMDSDHVADTPQFAVPLPWDDLDSARSPTMTIGDAQDYIADKVHGAIITRKIPDRLLEASWPSGCCVCGAPATRTETVTRRWILGPERIGRDRELTVKVEGVPYCDAHRAGVDFASIPGERGRFLKFRSYAYQKKFRQHNEWARGAPRSGGVSATAAGERRDPSRPHQARLPCRVGRRRQRARRLRAVGGGRVAVAVGRGGHSGAAKVKEAGGSELAGQRFGCLAERPGA